MDNIARAVEVAQRLAWVRAFYEQKAPPEVQYAAACALMRSVTGLCKPGEEKEFSLFLLALAEAQDVIRMAREGTIQPPPGVVVPDSMAELEAIFKGAKGGT